MNKTASHCAYVTLVTNDDYGLGALALLRSLKAVRAQWPLVVLAARNAGYLEALEREGARIIAVDQLPVSEAFRERHSRGPLHQAAPFTKGNKPNFHNPLDNFCKLRLWQLTEYRKVVFIDADAVAVKNIDCLLEYPEFCAAPNVYESLHDFQRMNSGVFVAKPSTAIYDWLLARLDQPGIFWRRTDQTFLQSCWPNWHGLPYIYNTLQYVFFNLPELWNWEQIRVVHYQYEKPWMQEHPKRQILQPLIDLWQQLFDHKTIPEQLPAPAIQERA